jgi:L-asparaginase II
VIAAEGPNPVFVEITRGGTVESRHRGAAAVVDADGALVAAWGDVDRPVFPRSAVKPIQAIPLLETGAADRFALTDAELALACASHGGAPEHLRVASDWLNRIGLGPGFLVCGPHPPICEEAAAALSRAGHSPTRLHNNCSGKHAGFLTTALHLGAPTAGYGAPDHPIQRLVRQALSEMGGVDLRESAEGADGCGVPVIAMPLSAIARGFAALADPDRLGPRRAAAVRRIVAAMAAHPDLVAGPGRFETAVMRACGGAVIVKGGAEGVCAAVLPGTGLGIAVKIDDGAKRAAETAMAALLARFASLDRRGSAALDAYLEMPVANTTGDRVGAVRLAPGWPG